MDLKFSMNEVFVFHRGQSYLHFQSYFELNTCHNLVKSEQNESIIQIEKNSNNKKQMKKNC